MIFPDFKRTDTYHRLRNVTSYNFFNNSAWPVCEFYRNYINRSIEPFIDDKEFLSRYKSANDYHHESASFELLMYQQFKGQGFKVEKHPDLGVPKRADFKVSQAGMDIIIECTLAGSTLEDGVIKNRKDALEAIADEMYYFPYWINIKYVGTSLKSISARKFKSFVNTKVKEIDHLTQEQQLHEWFDFENNDWQLQLSFVKKNNSQIKRSLGFTRGLQANERDKGNPLLLALEDKKPRKYNIENKPYIICLNASESFISSDLIQRALYGNIIGNKVYFNDGSPDCFYFREGEPVNTSVAGVAIFKNLSLFNLNNLEYSLWCNPFAKNPVPLELFQIPACVLSKAQDNFELTNAYPKKDIFTLLGIDKKYYESMNQK